MENNNKFKYTEYYKRKVDLEREHKEIKKILKDLEGKAVKEGKEHKKEKTEYKAKKSKYIIIFKIFIFFIPLIIISYLFYVNFLVSHEFNYFYDIGSEEDIKNPYLFPDERISEKINISENAYRFLKGHLIYFNSYVPRGSEKINLQAKFIDNFPENSLMNLGINDKEEWHYSWNLFFKEENSTYREIISETSFNISEAYIDSNRNIKFALSIPHLTEEQYQDNYIPIDWINITVYKPGLLDKGR
jgi:hypothetical protein